MSGKRAFLWSGFGIAWGVMVSAAVAQTTWTGAGDGVDWADPGNWSDGLPSPEKGAIFGNIPTGITALFVDQTVASLAFVSGVRAGDDIMGVGPVTLTVNDSITNSTNSLIHMTVPVSTGVLNPTWDGPIRLLNSVSIGTKHVTLVDDVRFFGTVNIDLIDQVSYGRFLDAGAGNFNGSTINLTGSFAGLTSAALFDFTTGSFTGAILNVASLPALPPHLTWDTSRFISEGILFVGSLATPFPEPSALSALAGGVAFGFAICRRRGVRSERWLK